MKREMNTKCKKALKVWREAHQNEDGKLDMDAVYEERREKIEDRIKKQEAYLKKLRSQLAALDNKQNKAKKAALLSKYTLEELLEKIGEK